MAQRRRRRDPAKLRTKGMRIALTPVERGELEVAAASQGATLSVYARELLFRRSAAVVAATRRNPEARDLIHALNDCGNLLNQIARHLNTASTMRDTDPALLHFALDQHKRAIARVLDL